ncbi:hypothetical protein [Parafrankia discariae]|uniref:hypothetical protein n=1 Tax=Parafrankia discariae TaxID=365528 RepID=UPI0003A2009A|nr:hypothetical protein [Parafrankia discariae]
MTADGRGRRAAVSKFAGAAARLGLVVSGTALAGPLAGLAVVVARAAQLAVRRAADQRYEAELRGAAEDVLAALSTELDAGAAPDEALRTALFSVGDLPTRHRRRRRGAGHGDRRSRAGAAGLPTGGLDLGRLRELLPRAEDPARLLARCEASALRQLATAYRVCRLAGVRLAPVATMLADAARADAARADELASALAGPRSSGRLVAGLPLLGLALGALVGASPVEVLLTGSAGRACLTAGVLLDLAGLRWLRRIADGVQAQVPPVCAGPPPAGRRRGGPTSREYRRRLLADLPLALDLVAACLRSGATTQHALEVVGVATGGAAGSQLKAAGRAMRRGVPVDEACDRLLAAGGAPRTNGTPRPNSAPRPGGSPRPGAARAGTGRAGSSRAVGRRRDDRRTTVRRGTSRRRETRVVTATAAAIGRTESSGAKLAATLTRIGDRARQEAHAAAIAAARRAGVLAVAPLGLCFLPAFLLLGVVPVVIGSAPDLGQVFGSTTPPTPQG